MNLSGICDFPRKSDKFTKYEGRKPVSRKKNIPCLCRYENTALPSSVTAYNKLSGK